MKFAHFADIHLGFQKKESLQKVEQDVFENAMNQCIASKVDFIIISGDLFHVNIPDMRVQKFAFAKFLEIHDAGIPIYAVYGSHDFSPISNSVIDLLSEIGFIIKVTDALSNADGTISLNFITDKKTGAKITGLSGLKTGKDREWYEKIQRGPLESESGFKIFVFHGGVTEVKDMHEMGDYMPLSLLPKNFDYYAGGHLHKKLLVRDYANHPNVVYPGTLFAGYHSDLEANAKGEERGFYMVEFEEKIKSIQFMPIENIKYEIIDINADNKKVETVNHDLAEKANSIDAKDKVIIVKITGQMMSGKTSDVDIFTVKENLKNAMDINISKNQLSSKEYTITEAKGANKDEIETNVFSENIGQLKFSTPQLLGDQGVALAKKLLTEMGQPIQINEKKQEYENKVTSNAFAILGLEHDP